MNIFVLDKDPKTAARLHNDKHVVKMILESAQILSTAHRVLDGRYVTYPKKTKIGKYRRTKAWSLNGPKHQILYKATHSNHPCSLWCRKSSENYKWLLALTEALCDEYYHRYGSHKNPPMQHSVRRSGMLDILQTLPDNIPEGPLTPFALAMPDQYKSADSVQSYRDYYVGEKAGIMKYTRRDVPGWVERGVFKKSLKEGQKQ